MARLLLNIVVFISGAVLMALEIVGSRVLAPHFGNSIFVWGSLISIVLAALSLGYYWGGWLSERSPSFARLLVLLLIPGVLIFFLPFVYPSINQSIAEADFGSRLPDVGGKRRVQASKLRLQSGLPGCRIHAPSGVIGWPRGTRELEGRDNARFRATPPGVASLWCRRPEGSRKAGFDRQCSKTTFPIPPQHLGRDY